ncbi:hypothetical protein SVAN01_09186 [Stagonosporopsis vannaccii]|nr:hypothetical protein SVAN01_09186 [Stagonosporopsis vannaccii]
MSTSTLSTLSRSRQFETFLDSVDDATILRHCLGLEAVSNAPAIAEDMIVVAFDTESWVWDSSKLTEIGFCVFDFRDLRRVEDVGPYGENLLMGMYWYPIRVQPIAHLVNQEHFLRGYPELSRFGTTRFLSVPEVKNFLTEAFGWKVDENSPDLGNCLVLGTVVKTIDTQPLATSTGLWRGQPIGPRRLCGMLDFEPRNEHTACNDIGMTVIAALQMVLPAEYKSDQFKPLQKVVDNLEQNSRTSHGTTAQPLTAFIATSAAICDSIAVLLSSPVSTALVPESQHGQKSARSHQGHKCLQMLQEKAQGHKSNTTSSFGPITS